MAGERILIVEDEDNARSALASILVEEGYAVDQASDGEEALAKVEPFDPEVILTDVRMPKLDGIDLIKAARKQGSEAAFVVMTAFGSIETAVEAMKLGAENYLTKPLHMDAALVCLRRVLDNRALVREAHSLRESVRARYRFGSMVGESPALQGVLQVVKQAAPTKATVLILGESGTGKELIAQALHEASPRAGKPFVKVNCAALSESLLESELFGHEKGSFTGAAGRREGRFERANGGTLFLDEIGDVTPATQVKLLRVLQTREFERVGGSDPVKVDVRLVAATNRNLAAATKAGTFREDLYYRLNVVSVTLPPLRDRRSDIVALVSYFIEKYSQSYAKKVRRVSPGALAALMAHDWPGNVRELENAVERAVVLCQAEEITAADLPPVLQGPRIVAEPEKLIPGASLGRIEREAILQTLAIMGGSVVETAKLLGISVRKVQYRLVDYGREEHGLPPTSPAEPEEEAALAEGAP